MNTIASAWHHNRWSFNSCDSAVQNKSLDPANSSSFSTHIHQRRQIHIWSPSPATPQHEWPPQKSASAPVSPSNPSNWTWRLAWLGIKNKASTESASWPTILLLMCRVAATKPAHSASLNTAKPVRVCQYPVVFQLRVQASIKDDKHDIRLHIRSFCLLSLLFTMLSKTSDLKRGKIGSCSFSGLHSFDFKRFDLFALEQFLKGRRHTEACMKQLKHGCCLNMLERWYFSTLKSSFEVITSIVDKSWSTSWYWLKWSQTTRYRLLSHQNNTTQDDNTIFWGFMRKQHDFRGFPQKPFNFQCFLRLSFCWGLRCFVFFSVSRFLPSRATRGWRHSKLRSAAPNAAAPAAAAAAQSAPRPRRPRPSAMPWRRRPRWRRRPSAAPCHVRCHGDVDVDGAHGADVAFQERGEKLRDRRNRIIRHRAHRMTWTCGKFEIMRHEGYGWIWEEYGNMRGWRMNEWQWLKPHNAWMLWLIKRDNSWQKLDLSWETTHEHSFKGAKQFCRMNDHVKSIQKVFGRLTEKCGLPRSETLCSTKHAQPKRFHLQLKARGIPDPSVVLYFSHSNVQTERRHKFASRSEIFIQSNLNHQNHNIHRTLWRFDPKLPGGKIPTTNQADAGMVQTFPLSCGPKSCLFTQLLCQILDSSSCTTCVRCMYD